jgi:hypothetical protein
MTRPPHEPTSTLKPATNGRGDTPPPAPPHEVEPDRGAGERRFTADGAEWLVRRAGKGACGTGAYGLGLVEALHFFESARPEVPRREALLARGRFDSLYDDELRALLAAATPIVLPG